MDELKVITQQQPDGTEPDGNSLYFYLANHKKIGMY